MTRRTLTVTCDYCGKLARRHLADAEHEVIVLPGWRAELAAEGWAYDGALDICPTCIAATPVAYVPFEETTR